MGLLAIATALHLTILDHFRILGCKPDIIFSLVIFFGLFGGPRRGLAAGFTAGLLNDIYSSGRFGSHILIFSLIGFIMGRIAPRFYRESRFAQFTLTAGSYILAASLYYLFMLVASGTSALDMDSMSPYLDFFANSIIPGSIYTGLVSAVLFRPLMEWFEVTDGLLL